MGDAERLSLLKEIGGSKVYEDRRTESLQILQDAEVRKSQIAELVSLCLSFYSPCLDSTCVVLSNLVHSELTPVLLQEAQTSGLETIHCDIEMAKD